uniref:Uncharacterized protein n=1 Tax=Sinocyclocheilus anshuiensis TaxID=1608454 RepID=A0A671KHQ5_9TELE
MAESSDDQSPFTCPICLHLLKSPVTTACGHSFCMDCLNECWDRDDQKGVYSCPQCRQTFSPRPALSRSTVLAEVVERMKREAPETETASTVPSFAVSGDVVCDVCTKTKTKAIKSCLTCLASYCESHIKAHKSPALKWHNLVNISPHLMDQICSQHHKPLELYCCQHQQLICVQCALITHQNHKMTSPASKRGQIQEQMGSNQNVLEKEMQTRAQKVQELRKAVACFKVSTAVEHSEKVFTELIRSMEKRRAEITEVIRAQEKAEVSNVEELIRTLEHEISDLRKRHDELGQLSQIKDDIYVIQNFSALSLNQFSNLNNISISQHLTFEEIETVVSLLKSQLDDLCDQDISMLKFIINFLFSCKQLCINRMSVSRRSDKCFNSTYQVSCKESLSGRCYFEVQLGGAGCSIAFSYDALSQGGTGFIFGSNNRSWKCDFPTANVCVWQSNQQTNIPVVFKIGVFLDQDAGTVSFYNVSDKMTLLHRIQTTFTASLYTGFSFQNWENNSSVTICELKKK